MTGQQLKNSILQMAVQGKLVPQDPNDEPASVLLARIRKEKEELIKAGKIKKEKNPSYIFRGADNLPYEKVGKNEPVCIADEVPFDIPDTWEWVRLSTICQLIDGIKMNNKNYHNLDARYMRGKSEPKTINSGKFVSAGSYLILVDGENSGEVFIAPEDGYMGSTFKLLWFSEQIIDKYFLHFIDLNKEILKNSKKGAAIPHLNKELFFNLFLPIPPCNEQKRIVEKLSTLAHYVNEYANHQNELNILNSNFPDTLKKSILQEAVQGKLVPQDTSDEPASVLLERIRSEKQRLIAEGKIKKDKHESVIFRRDNSHYEKQGSEEVCIDEELPFEVPKNWQWIRLSDLVHFIGGYAYKSETFIETSEYQVLRLGNIKNDKIKYSTKPVFISKELSQKTVDFQCKTNDILLTMTGTRLKRDYFYTVLVSEKDTNCFINQRVGCLRSYLPSLSRWLIWTLKSEAILSQVFQHETGTANQGNLGAENIMKTFIPLPPLDEQERICNVIDRLLREVDTL